MAPSLVGTGALQRGHRRGTPQLPQSGRAQHGSARPSVGLPPQIAHDGGADGGAAAGGGAAGAAHWRVVCSTSTASAQRTARLAMSSVMPRGAVELSEPLQARNAFFVIFCLRRQHSHILEQSSSFSRRGLVANTVPQPVPSRVCAIFAVLMMSLDASPSLMWNRRFDSFGIWRLLIERRLSGA